MYGGKFALRVCGGGGGGGAFWGGGGGGGGGGAHIWRGLCMEARIF